MQWEVVIGLENHVQLTTNSKIFSGSAIRFGAEPNTQASPVDLALPGVLPVMNKGAVERAIRFGLAVNAKIAPQSIFALTARPNSMARSTAPLFITGSVPGSARSTGDACVFGSAPNAVGERLKILLSVESCACVSKPMTTS